MDRSLVQGSMDMLIMQLLSEKDMYGYEMIEVLHKRSNQVFELKAGSLYPLLHTLEGKGFIAGYEEDSTGKSRKYYHLTREGRKRLTEKKAEWQSYQQAVSSVLAMRRRRCEGGLCYGI